MSRRIQCNHIFNMTNRRNISHIESQFTNINKSFRTIVHHLTADDNGLARLEMGYIMSAITELCDAISNLDNIGRQPEEKLILNNIKNCTDCILVKLQ